MVWVRLDPLLFANRIAAVPIMSQQPSPRVFDGPLAGGAWINRTGKLVEPVTWHLLPHPLRIVGVLLCRVRAVWCGAHARAALFNRKCMR